MRLLVAALVVATVVAGDGTEFGNARTKMEQGGGSAKSLPPPRPLGRTPTRLLQNCERSRLLAPVCPRRLLKNYGYSSRLCRAGARGCLFEGIDMFSVESRPSPNAQTRRPPFVHVVLYAGDLGGPKGFQAHAHSAFPFDWLDPSSARPLIDGLTRHRRAKAIALGRYGFGSVVGELVLAPTTHAMDAGHVIFRWRSARWELAMSLHAWEPLTEAVSTLRAIVRSAPAARR
jgi:hypothetical protein